MSSLYLMNPENLAKNSGVNNALAYFYLLYNVVNGYHLRAHEFIKIYTDVLLLIDLTFL